MRPRDPRCSRGDDTVRGPCWRSTIIGRIPPPGRARSASRARRSSCTSPATSSICTSTRSSGRASSATTSTRATAAACSARGFYSQVDLPRIREAQHRRRDLVDHDQSAAPRAARARVFAQNLERLHAIFARVPDDVARRAAPPPTIAPRAPPASTPRSSASRAATRSTRPGALDLLDDADRARHAGAPVDVALGATSAPLGGNARRPGSRDAAATTCARSNAQPHLRRPRAHQPRAASSTRSRRTTRSQPLIVTPHRRHRRARRTGATSTTSSCARSPTPAASSA